ncbi:MAG TPA: tol-pal system protein YbgF [Gammaproteobacteria bacterium]|nr:tol-pal system protein YbgF [Gammaproteobacteria bacterium]
MRKILLLPAAIGLASCSSLTPVNDPVYLRIQDMEARLIRIERVLENESLISLAGDITSLRNEVQQLLGEVETLRFELNNQAEGNRSLYSDLDRRLQNLEAAQQQLRSMPLPSSRGGVPVAAANDQQAYDAAFALVERQSYAGAQGAFQSFLASYPQSQLRANAQYWLAETHYAQLSFRTALAEFQRVIDDYPLSNKLPDALLKIGYSNHELGNRDAARQALLRVLREYPDTEIATRAEERLARIAGETR